VNPSPPYAIEQLAVPADVLKWSVGQPYLSADVSPADVMHAVKAVEVDGSVSAVGFIRKASGDRDHPWVTVLGEDARIVDLLLDLLARYGDLPSGGLIGGVTAPARLRELLSDTLLARSPSIRWGLAEQGAPWDWWWTSAVRPATSPHEVQWLDANDAAVADQIRALLAVASPTHWAPPEHPHVERWAGIKSADGSLAACVAETVRIPGRPHLASVATHPKFRGQGMAAEVTGWITAALLAEGVPLVSLGMYAHNDVARRVYTRLGYTCAYSWFSSGFASMPASERC